MVPGAALARNATLALAVLFLLSEPRPAHSAAACGNGVREAASGEECDDGNVFSGDGCSSTCVIEDPTSDTWLCPAPDGAKTLCCPTRINPVTSAKVCSCAGQAPLNDGYTITPLCEERDVDECSVSSGPGPCHENAVCENLNGIVGPAKYRCTCPPGMLGDGVSRCDVKDYLTTFVFGIAATTPEAADASAIVSGLYASQVIPASVDRSRVNATIGTYRPDMPLGGGGGRRRSRHLLSPGTESSSEENETAAVPESGLRRLLWRGRRSAPPSAEASTQAAPPQPGAVAPASAPAGGEAGDKRRQITQAGTQVKVVIRSTSPVEMENTTASINMASLDPSYTPLAQPSSEVSIIDTAFAPVEVDVAGFSVDSVAYSKVNYKWVVTARYKPDVDDTITGIYVSKVGPPPYSTAVTNSFFPSQHPCVLSLSVCCLNDFKANYMIGSFASNITQTIGACDASVQALPTQGLFNPALDEQFVDGLFADYPNSDVYRTGPGRVQLVIAETDLRNSFAKREEIPSVPGQTYTGYRLEFFVGMAYFTLLPTNAMSTTVSQTKVTVVVTDSLTFSFSSKQDYTFLRYMTMSLYQNKWKPALTTHYMQFARVAIVLPTGMRQNMQTGLIPTTSIRFAISRSLPDQADQSKWVNPCYSETNQGTWDDPDLFRPMYAAAAAQSCAMQHNMCVNPIAEIQNPNVIEFNFPIGDGFINSTHLSATGGFFLYVYFDVSAVDTTGRVVTTRLFAQARLHELSIATACESIDTTLSLLELTSVDIAIGLVGNQQDWGTSVYTADNVRQASLGGSLLDTTMLRNHSVSLQSGLVTLAVRGEPDVFASPLTSAYYIEIEHLTTIHFLDPAKFGVVRDMMAQQGSGFTVLKDTATDTLSIQLSQAVWDACSSAGGSVSCSIRHDIVKNQVRNAYAVHPFATGPGTTDTTATRDWITQNLLGVSDFSNALAANMTSLVRSKYTIDDRINRAWYINPGHLWPRGSGAAAQSTLLLSDKLILIAVIALRDGAGSIVRRRLMSTLPAAAGPPPTRAEVRRVAEGALQQRQGGPGQRRQAVEGGGAGNIVLVPRSADDEVAAAMEAISKAPRVEATPPINFGVPIAESVSKAAGVDPESPAGTMRVSLVGRFPAEWDEARVREVIAQRLKANQKMYCKACSGVFPVFYDMKRNSPGQPGVTLDPDNRRAAAVGGAAAAAAAASSVSQGRARIRHGLGAPGAGARAGRALLQQQEGGGTALPSMDDFRGTVDVIMSYAGERNEVLYTEVFRSLFRDTYTSGASIGSQAGIKSLAGGEIVVSSLEATPWASASFGGGGETVIVQDAFEPKSSTSPPPPQQVGGPSQSASWENGGAAEAGPTGGGAAAVAANTTANATSSVDQDLDTIAEMMNSAGVRRSSGGSALDTIFLGVVFIAASMVIAV